MSGREEDIKKMVEGVLDVDTKFWDDPNGSYTHTCPFCDNDYYSYGSMRGSMHDIEHAPDCIYLVAKDLNTT